MGFIFYISSVSGKDLPEIIVRHDMLFRFSIYHSCVYLVLGYLFRRALKNTYPDMVAKKVFLITVLFGVLYGVTDELHQVFVPYRTVSVLDVFNDGVGSFLGSLIYR
jgi:VanZ family protein